MDTRPITVETTVHAPLQKVWDYWTKPEHIVKWAFADDSWEAPYAENDIRTGGTFKTVMAARDKSQQFDFTGVYTAVIERKSIEYTMDDGRHVKIVFSEIPDGVQVTETFEPEQENTPEFQKQGWQAIMDNFKKYTESV